MSGITPAAVAITEPEPSRALSGSVARFLRLVRLESWRYPALPLLPLLIPLVAWVIWDKIKPWTPTGNQTFGPWPEVWLWSDLMNATLAAPLVCAPIAAGFAVVAAQRERQRRMFELVMTTSGAEHRRFAPLTAAVLVSLLTCVLGALPWYLITWHYATWGGPDAQPIALALATVSMGATVGFLAGTRVRSLIVAPVVSIVLFVLLAMSDLGPNWLTWVGALFSLDNRHHQLVTEPLWASRANVAAAWALVGWIVALAAVGWCLTVTFGRDQRSRFPVKPSLALLVSLSLSLGLGSVVIRDDARARAGWSSAHADVNQWPQIAPLAELACQGSDSDIEVCVHPAFMAHLDVITPMVQSVMRPLQGVSAAPTRFEQLALSPYISVIEDNVLYLNHEFRYLMYLDDLPRNVVQALVTDGSDPTTSWMPWYLSRSMATSSDDSTASSHSQAPSAAQRVVAYWLFDQTETPRPRYLPGLAIELGVKARLSSSLKEDTELMKKTPNS